MSQGCDTYVISITGYEIMNSYLSNTFQNLHKLFKNDLEDL